VATHGLHEAGSRACLASPGEGEGGCVFDKMGNLVGPTERPTMGGGLGRLAIDGVVWPERPGATRNAHTVFMSPPVLDGRGGAVSEQFAACRANFVSIS